MSSAARVLLLGNGRPHHVGACFERALRQLGHPYRFVDEAVFAPEPPGGWIMRSAHRVPGVARLARLVFARAVMAAIAAFRPDVVFVVKGAFLTPRVLAAIARRSKATLVNYATDDPFNSRASTLEIRKSVPFYDLYVSTRTAILTDLTRAGARKVAWVPFAYDPELHFPEVPRDFVEANVFRSDVAFVGGGDEDRASAFTVLADRNHADIHLYGGYWTRYPELRRFAKGFVFGRQLRLVLGGTRVAPCLVRRANRDGHVMRTFEIPACGAFMLAERTEEHAAFFEEGRDFACFDSSEELADKVAYYLRDDSERARLARNGHERVIHGRHTYRDRLSQILDLVRTGHSKVSA